MNKLIAILTMTSLLGVVAAADARFRAGTYKGETKRDKPVSFTATKREVSAFKIKVRYGCTDFDTFWTSEKGFPIIKIGDEGKFSGRFTNADGSYKSKIKGTLTGRTAKGSFIAERTYDAQGNLDPQGDVTCYAHKTTWSAEKTR
jgi:hypothetical protein